jgi:multidrug resistance efflux pump
MSEATTPADETAAPTNERLPAVRPAPPPGPPPAPPPLPPAPEVAPAPAAVAPAGKGSRVGAIILLLLILTSLAWYFVADRLTPYTSQARLQAFVVPVAAEVAGKVLKVHVRNNDEVMPGQPLFDIDPQPYRITLQRSRSDYEAIRQSVNATTTAVAAARAGVQAATAVRVSAEQDAARLEQIHAADPGAISVRRVESAQANRIKTRAQELAAQADLQRALDTAGERGDKNAQLLSARAGIEKAELDLTRTQVLAPARGMVTDLRTDVGQFAQVGAAAMTLIATHDLWISVDLTENNLGNVKVGDAAAIVLDVMPGEVLKGRVRSLGGGISAGKPPPPGTLPEVSNSRDWLRQSQRFPVAVEFDPSERERLRGLRVGGQADVMIYTGDHGLMNWLGACYIGLMSKLSYLY